MQMELLVAGAVGALIGAFVVVMFSKNNKNTIAKIREEVLEAANKGEKEIKKVIEKYS
jgi:hypothetical protein